MRAPALTLAVAMATAVAAAQTPTPHTQTPTPAAPAAKKAPAKSPPPDAPFDALVAQATEARKAERWEDAIALYARAVKLRPQYVEGYWYQGTASYTIQKFTECRDRFREVVALAPQNGAAFAFLGLCEYGTKEFDASLHHLLQSRTLGVGDTGDLGGVARYHAASILLRIGEFEQALQMLGEFANEGDDNPRVIEAMGIATLRMPIFPEDLPADRRQMVLMAGRASYQMATRNTVAAGTSFAALVGRYPETPNVHYANGVYLLAEQPDKAIEEFKKELELQPGHPQSLMQIAFEYLNRGDARTALSWATQAEAAAPDDFAARKVLGQALLDTGDADGAIAQLQAGIKLAPESPSLHFQLARAYQKAGRLEDANKERDEFTRLDRLARETKTGPQSVGGIGRGNR
jgi:tetratricopeptide (TPR) repeat protein